MILGSRYFAAGYFAARSLGSVPAKEEVTFPVVPGTLVHGGGLIDFFKDAALRQAGRKRKDEELLGMIALFAVLEDEDNGIL